MNDQPDGWTDEDWKRVGDALKARMTELGGLTQRDLVERSGVSRETIGAMIRGRSGNYTQAKKAPIAGALGWTSDSIDLVLKGYPPQQATDYAAANALLRGVSPATIDDLDRIAGRLQRQVDDVREELEEVTAALDLVVVALDELTGDTDVFFSIDNREALQAILRRRGGRRVNEGLVPEQYATPDVLAEARRQREQRSAPEHQLAADTGSQTARKGPKRKPEPPVEQDDV